MCAVAVGSAVDEPAEAAGVAEILVTSRLLATCPPLFMAKLTLAVSPTARSASVADFPCFRTAVEDSVDRVHTFPLAVRTWRIGDAAVQSSAVIEPSIEMIPSSAGAGDRLAGVVVAAVGGFVGGGGGAFGLAGSGAACFASGWRAGGNFGAAGVPACGAAGREVDEDAPDAV